MNALAQVFVFVSMLSIGDATQPPKRKPPVLRREVIQIDSSSAVQHIQSAVSKKQRSRRSELIGKIEQGGSCLAAKVASLGIEDEDPLEIMMVDCDSHVHHELEWEADSEGIAGHIELRHESSDEELCLQAYPHFYDLVGLVKCETNSSKPKYEWQQFTYNNLTNEITSNATGSIKCLTHDEESLHLKIEDCEYPLNSTQEFVFEESHHSHPNYSRTELSGKIEHNGTSTCVAAHLTSHDEEDLEVVNCTGDGNDELEWITDAAIEDGHIPHAPHRIKLKTDSCDEHDEDCECLTADSAFVGVVLRACHTHTQHHRQKWVYDEETMEFQIEDPDGVAKCLAKEPDDEEEHVHEDGLVLENCTDSTSDEQKWKWD